MKRTSIGSAVAGAVVSALMASSFGVSPAMAQSDCTCVLPAGVGPVGSISTASPDVFVTGATGQQAAAAGASLTPGSVVTTGPNATAAINLGGSCRFGMTGSMRMQIVPQGGNLCVQVIDESLTVPPGEGGGGAGIATVAGLAAGAGVVVSLGMLLAVSN